MLFENLKKAFDTVIIAFSVINVICKRFNRAKSPGSNVTPLTEHNTGVYMIMTLM